MDIKFDKQAVESFINDAAQRAWNNEVQDNALISNLFWS